MNYQQIVEDHIRKELPELMELGIGCEVEVTWLDGKKETAKYLEANTLTLSEYLDENELRTNGDDCSSCTFRKDEVKILGHPITIAHYLRVLGNHPTSHHYHMMMDGELILKHWPDFDSVKEKTVLKFNLTTQAPQSEEDYKKLAELFELV